MVQEKNLLEITPRFLARVADGYTNTSQRIRKKNLPGSGDIMA